MSAPRRKRLPRGWAPWLVGAPESFIDEVAHIEATAPSLDDPVVMAHLDQFAAAQRDAIRMMITAPMARGLRVAVSVAPDRKKLAAWILAAISQATQRGMDARRCPHVFRTATPGWILVGYGVAACIGCMRDHAADSVIKAGHLTDDRCEVCGALVPPGAGNRFWPAHIPVGGLLVVADQCRDCRNWLSDALGGLPS